MKRLLWPLMLGVVACGRNTTNEALVPVVDLPDTVTFVAHIAPILRTECMPCHRPGQAGPFPLITYADARKKARTIQKVTTHRYMPPWPADTAYARYLGERVLTARQIALIARWVEQGALPGDTAALSPPPVFPEGSLWGEPDAVVWMPDTFRIPGDNLDRFLVTKAPFELPRDTFLRAIEFVPGNRRAVHHMNGAMVSYTEGMKRDVAEGSAYIDADRSSTRDAYAALRFQQDDGSWPMLTPNIVNHLPGMAPVFLPAGIGGHAIKRKGAFLLNTLHYGPSLRDTVDRSRFNLWFMPGPPERPMKEIQLGSLGLTPVVPELIVPADSVKTFSSRYVVPTAISVVTINPHMHLLGRTFLAYAVTPAHDTIPLVRINDWDFRWQYAYTFPHLLPIPAGSVIEAFGTFDNTRNNPHNPFDPPRTAYAPHDRNMRTTDEMFQFFVNYVDHRPGDATISLAPADRAPLPAGGR